jgi:predicted DNA binding CopG/RHH family protein
MSKISTKANFKSFTIKAKEAKDLQKEEEISPPLQASSYRYFQVRLAKDDAHRLKAAISSKGLSVQSIMIEAINLWMSSQGHSPISDPGTAREKPIS